MKNGKIGIFDSGIGGFTILDKLEEILPNESYIYYKDSKNNPYGEKSIDELYEIVKNIVEILISKNVKLIVIACNTATTMCMKKLRKEYPKMIFVGTVPAIKVACDNNKKNTLVMATPLTIKSDRTKELINDNKKNDQEITLVTCHNLAHAIETNKDVDLVLDKILTPYKDKNIDSVVLGCTHYPLIKDKIQKYFKNASIYDSSLGVSMEVKRKLTSNNLLTDSKKCKTVIIDSANIEN